MALKELWKKVTNWWLNRGGTEIYPSIDQEGLIRDTGDDTSEPSTPQQATTTDKNEIVVKKSASIDRKQSIEVLGEAFNSLVEQLQGINENLTRQADQHAELMGRIDQLPELLEALPGAVDTQKHVVDVLTEQLKGRALKDEQFAEIVEKIPTETTKQTQALIDMNRKLSVCADVDVQMNDSFNKFNETLVKLDVDTTSQTDGISQMSKTFAASDRYLKFIISRQHRRFMWVFITAMSVCVLAIISLVIAIAVALRS